MDNIQIKGLSVLTRIGVHDWEQQIQQRLLIDLLIPTDFSKINDVIAETVDYDALCKALTEYVENQSFQLIETVANRAALFIKEQFKLNEISITVHKPQAVKNAQSISVTATR